MKKGIKVIWLKRLRSGEVPQGTGCLGTDDGKRCCLGLLCDIAVEEGVIPQPKLEQSAQRPNSNRLKYDTEAVVLPIKVQKWAKLKNFSPQFLEHIPIKDGIHKGTPTNTLVSLNDCGYTFEEIADVIENQHIF